MLLERLSDFLGKNKTNKAIFITIIILLLITYLVLFLTPGIEFEGYFLQRYNSPEQILYKGSTPFGDIRIFLIGEKHNTKTAQLIYELPLEAGDSFYVDYKEHDNWYEGIIRIKDSNGGLLFSGLSHYYGLVKSDGHFYIESPTVSIDYNGIASPSPFHKDYKVSLNHVAKTATLNNNTIRGDWRFMLYGILFLFLVTIDFIEPDLFFNIRHALWTDYAEPSEWYRAMQRFGWNVFPVLGVGLLIASLVV